jgi:hypothetical protein
MSATIPGSDVTFEQLVSTARKRIPSFSKIWSDLNESDPGITFIELFAWLADIQIYSLNKINQKSYIRFLKLLGTSPQSAETSKLDLAIERINEEDIPLIEIDKGMRFLASGLERNTIIYESDEKVTLLPVIIRTVLSHSNFNMTVVTEVCSNVDASYFYAFGKEPIIGNAFYIGIESKLLDSGYEIGKETKIYLSFYLFEEDLPELGKHGDEQLNISFAHRVKWEYCSTDSNGSMVWREMKEQAHEFNDGTSGLTRSGRISFNVPFDKKDKCRLVTTSYKNKDSYNENVEIDCERNRFSTGQDSSLYWIRCKVEKSDYEIVPRIDAISPNTIFTTYGETFAETLVRKDGIDIFDSELTLLKDYDIQKSTGLPNQSFKIHDDLSHERILENTGLSNNLIRINHNKRTPVGRQTPIMKIISITTSNDKNADGSLFEWTIVNDLDSSLSTDYNCLADLATGTVTFGDGEKGRIPTKGSIVSIKYRAGKISDSIVKPNSVFQKHDDNSIDVNYKITNPTPPITGRDQETIESATRRMKSALSNPSKAATLTDYEYLVMNTPGLRLARAKAFFSSSEENTVKVIVVPYSLYKTPVPSTEFLFAVLQHLDRHRILTTKVEVKAPSYVGIAIKAEIVKKPRVDSDVLLGKLRQKLDDFLSPTAKKYDKSDGWSFGSPIRRSDLIVTLMDVKGVDSVKNLALIGSTSDDNTTYDIDGSILIKEQCLPYLKDCQIDILGYCNEPV